MKTDLSEKEKQELSSKFLIAQFLGGINFVAQKLGPTGMDQMNEVMAKSAAEQLKKMNRANPKGFSIACTVCAERAFGSDVELTEDTDNFICEHKKCGTLTNIDKQNISERKEFCNWCIEFYKKVANYLNLKVNVELTKNGCKMIVKK